MRSFDTEQAVAMILVGLIGMGLAVWNGATFWHDAPTCAAFGIGWGGGAIGVLVGKAIAL